MIAAGYKLHKKGKQFSDVAKISTEIAWQPRVKMDFKVTSFLTEFNPLLPDLNRLVRNRLPLLYNDPKTKLVIPERSIKTVYKRGKNMKEILSPSSFPLTKNLIVGSISNCNNRYDICTKLWFLVLPLNALQQVSTKKLKELYLVIVSMWYT